MFLLNYKLPPSPPNIAQTPCNISDNESLESPQMTPSPPPRASITILISFPIALIKPLKAQFIVVDGYYMPSAPDGEPPLAFFIDFAEFMGAASVPLGVICLGFPTNEINEIGGTSTNERHPYILEPCKTKIRPLADVTEVVVPQSIDISYCRCLCVKSDRSG
ncbi:hypothetical protein IW261DRAFT_1676939 [Armillaria novae-zelandiae]|uniref:Uncharacterized protein n=1 Tax=Armillaria novae-zelandiae TaxID=153914 RepID=A0AA39NNI4_9AGAR|nr:hypothetical protein IW261DRAFT_1676939 [Armillaria novae-zelandiae]